MTESSKNIENEHLTSEEIRGTKKNIFNIKL